MFLCVTCPVILIFLAGLSSFGILNISDRVATAVGLLFLFAQIGCAVFIFITNSGKLSKFDYFEKEAFETEYGVDGMVREKMAAHEHTNMIALTTGVLMCILGSVPLIITSVMGLSNFVILCMVCLLLFFVATATYLFVAICGVHSSYKVLLQTDGYTVSAKKTNKKLEVVTRIYWMFIVVVYLAVSFITKRWDFTWIIWAVSGVLYALIRVIGESIVKEG